MKRLISFMLIMLMLTVMVGCRKENKTEDPVEETPEVVAPESEEKTEEEGKETAEPKEPEKEDQKETSSSSDKKPSSNTNSNSNSNSDKEEKTEENKEDKRDTAPSANQNNSSSNSNKTENTNTNSGNQSPAKPNPAPQKEKTVVDVVEGVNGSGCKYVITVYSDGSSKEVVECQYCHAMPCPNGGGNICSQYTVTEDGAKTCQQCGRPYGNGHNGTCYSEIDWDNGGKIICHNYD